MKIIGIIGGIGPPSTVKYYEWLTQGVGDRLGGINSAKIILTSLNGEEVRQFRLREDNDGEGAYYAAEARRLETAGADFILIASNTSHKNVPYIEAAVSIPVLHLAEATAKRVKNAGLRKIGLLGTLLTMETDFYQSYLKHEGLSVIVPEKVDRDFVSKSIYEEFMLSVIRPEVRDRFISIIADLKSQGAEGIILGCTELTLLNLEGENAPDLGLPVFDTTKIHVEAAIEFALK